LEVGDTAGLETCATKSGGHCLEKSSRLVTILTDSSAKTRWLPRRHSQHSGKPMKTKLTQRRIKARKSSACGLCQP
jgi:hypothetical protein